MDRGPSRNRFRHFGCEPVGFDGLIRTPTEEDATSPGYLRSHTLAFALKFASAALASNLLALGCARTASRSGDSVRRLKSVGPGGYERDRASARFVGRRASCHEVKGSRNAVRRRRLAPYPRDSSSPSFTVRRQQQEAVGYVVSVYVIPSDRSLVVDADRKGTVV